MDWLNWHASFDIAGLPGIFWFPRNSPVSVSRWQSYEFWCDHLTSSVKESVLEHLECCPGPDSPTYVDLAQEQRAVIVCTASKLFDWSRYFLNCRIYKKNMSSTRYIPRLMHLHKSGFNSSALRHVGESTATAPWRLPILCRIVGCLLLANLHALQSVIVVWQQWHLLDQRCWLGKIPSNAPSDDDCWQSVHCGTQPGADSMQHS